MRLFLLSLQLFAVLPYVRALRSLASFVNGVQLERIEPFGLEELLPQIMHTAFEFLSFEDIGALRRTSSSLRNTMIEELSQRPLSFQTLQELVQQEYALQSEGIGELRFLRRHLWIVRTIEKPFVVHYQTDSDQDSSEINELLSRWDRALSAHLDDGLTSVQRYELRCSSKPPPNNLLSSLARMKSLVLRGNQLAEGIRDLTFPEGLESLALGDNQLTSLLEVQLPGSLRVLNLSNNDLTSLSDVVFSENLQKLNLAWNLLTSLAGVKLPDGLRELHLSNNKLCSLQGYVFPESLKILSFDYNPIATLVGVSFPKGLRCLEMRSLGLHALDADVLFPPNLQELDLSDNHIQSIAHGILPPRLKCLVLVHNLIESLERFVWPPSLENLDVSGNKIRSIGADELPKELQRLELIFNRITTLDALRLPASLQSIDLSHNKIRTVAGSHFPDGLREVYFRWNPIRTFDATSFSTTVKIHLD